MKFYEIMKIHKKKIQPVGPQARDPLFKATRSTDEMKTLQQSYRFCVASVIFRQYVRAI
jgi:hypothetical protein